MHPFQLATFVSVALTVLVSLFYIVKRWILFSDALDGAKRMNSGLKDNLQELQLKMVELNHKLERLEGLSVVGVMPLKRSPVRTTITPSGSLEDAKEIADHWFFDLGYTEVRVLRKNHVLYRPELPTITDYRNAEQAEPGTHSTGPRLSKTTWVGPG